MAFNPLAMQAPEYNPAKGASKADVIKFTDVENQAAKAAGFQTPIAGGTPAGAPTGKVLATTTDPKTGITTQTIEVSDGWGGTTTKQVQSQAIPSQNTSGAQGAYDALYNEFKSYGLEALVEPLKGLIQQGLDAASFTLALQNTDAYKTRFAGNAKRIANGYAALRPADYIALENSYQKLMQNYGLPDKYWTKGTTGTQPGFEQLISGDVSGPELEQRLIEAQQKVKQANPEVLQALKSYYGDTINNGDILAYSLDPKNALNDIKRKVAAAEIGGAALAQNLGTSKTAAEQLQAAGITKQQAEQGYQQIAGYLPTATALSDIYKNQGLGAFDQSAAEAATFGTAGAAEAQRKRKKLSQLEQAQFSAQSGTAQSGALSRDRALTNYMLGTPGAGAF